jgi:hypothetical protein
VPALGVVPDTQNQKKKEQMIDGNTGQLAKQDEGAYANEPDGVVGAHADPVGDGAVLAHLLGQLLLDAEGLVGRLRGEATQHDGRKREISEEHHD